jgi:hypothetical protein
LSFLGAADLEISFKILPLKTHLKLVFPNAAPIVPSSTYDFKILILHYIRRLLFKFELCWVSSYSKEDF